MKEMRAKIKRWYLRRTTPILDPQTQTQKRRWTQRRSLEGGVREPLPRYTSHIPVQVYDSKLTIRNLQARVKQHTRKSKSTKG